MKSYFYLHKHYKYGGAFVRVVSGKKIRNNVINRMISLHAHNVLELPEKNFKSHRVTLVVKKSLKDVKVTNIKITVG